MLRDTLAEWTLVVALGGRAHLAEERLSVQRDDLHELAHAHGHEVQTTLPGTDAVAVDAALRGLDVTGGWRGAPAGASQEIFFLTTLDKTPGYVATMVDVALDHGSPLAELGIYLQPQHQGVACHCEFVLAYDPGSPATIARARAVYEQASRRLIDEGAYFSRPYGGWAEPVYARDAQSTRLLRAVKRIFDPNNILNPGKLCFPTAGGPDARPTPAANREVAS